METTKHAIKKIKQAELTVSYSLLEADQKELPKLQVYVFDANGKTLATSPLPGEPKGEVKVQLPAAFEAMQVRAVIGPIAESRRVEAPEWMISLMKEELGSRSPKLSDLKSKGAVQKAVTLKDGLGKVDFKVSVVDWKKWLLCSCEVTGKVVRRISMPDGTTKELGVCHAFVLLYEVDSFPNIIYKLPDKDLFRLRDELEKIVDRRRWPWPPPPPEDGFMERVNPVLEKAAARGVGTKISEVAFNPQPEPPGSPYVVQGDGINWLNPQPEPPLPVWPHHGVIPLNLPYPNPDPRVQVSEETVVVPDSYKTELAPVFMASSPAQLRSALVQKALLLQPFTCLLQKVLWHYHKDFLTWAFTDEQGRFDTTVYYPCVGDHPDLYFQVMQFISGSLHMLYNPGVACHTYWNYPSGSEVVIEVDDPAAITCAPSDPVDVPEDVTGLWILPYGVGGTLLNAIKATGLTDYSGIVDAPFGGWLGFRLGYSGSIPVGGAGKPFYYRWCYQKDGETGWHEFTETVVRHYVEELPGKLPTFPAFPLGPLPVNGMHLFRFKPHDPPGPSQAGGHTSWPVDDWFGDIYSGYLNTTSLPGGVDASAGLYHIRLEVFDENGAQINPGPGDFDFLVPTGYESDGVTVDARKSLPAEVSGGGYLFNLYIDNRVTHAAIDSPTIGSQAAGDECGFLRYIPGDLTPVNFDYHATQAGNHAYFSFGMKRGHNTVSDAGGEVAAVVPAATPPGGYAGDGVGNFSADFLASDLLGSCAEAAFLEELWVHAKATNGWQRIEAYDSFDSRAYALAPAAPTPSASS